MTDIITSNIAITFSDQKLRRLASMIASVDLTITEIQNQWSADGLSALFPNDTTSIVQDTSVTASDGRTPICGQDVQNFMAFLTSVQSSLGANSGALRTTINKIAVNPSTLV